MKTLSEGFELSKNFTVSNQDTAKNVGSGGLEVLATPVLACWVENIAYELIENSIDNEKTSVGSKLDLNHIAPTPVDLEVTIKIILDKIDRSRYIFTFSASDSVQEIANGIHERVVVNKDKFMTRVLNKKNG